LEPSIGLSDHTSSPPSLVSHNLNAKLGSGTGLSISIHNTSNNPSKIQLKSNFQTP